MYLRYSSSVVAPIMRSSPRASIGLIMLPASTAPFGAAGADDRVQLVDEGDDLALGVGDLLEDGLEPILELAAVLRARDHRADVERDQPLVAQALGHVALDDAPRQALDDRGLADAGLADEHRVVLRAAAQHLDDAADLLVAPDDRVELALARLLGEVATERSSAWYWSSGFSLVTRWLPRTSFSAPSTASWVTPSARSRSPTPPATSAMASSRCSVER